MNDDVRVIITPIFNQRRHEILQRDAADNLIWKRCSGPGMCRYCIKEAQEDYVSDETKKRIRSALEEHIGPSEAAKIGDRDHMVGPGFEANVFADALEAEFKVSYVPESLFRDAHVSVDDIARYIDTLVASRDASPH